MSEDCNRGHSSNAEESYFYKETQRLIDEMRACLLATAAQMAAPTPVVAPPAGRTRLAA